MPMYNELLGGSGPVTTMPTYMASARSPVTLPIYMNFSVTGPVTCRCT